MKSEGAKGASRRVSVDPARCEAEKREEQEKPNPDPEGIQPAS